MSNEWNKGYFSSGPQQSHQAQEGQWARERDDRAKEAAAQAARAQEQQHNDAMLRHAHALNTSTSSGGYSSASYGGSASPATLLGCMKGVATAGAIVMLAYAAFGLGVAGWSALAVWGLQGALGGAVAGVVLYAAIAILRVAFAVLAIVLKVALWAALAVAAFYVFANMA